MSDVATISTHRADAPAATFCRHLGRELVAKWGFADADFPQVDPIAAQCDVVLYRNDGCSFTIVGLVDRESNPGRALTLVPFEIEAVGIACRDEMDRLGEALPVMILLMEIGPASVDQPLRLAPIKPNSQFPGIYPSAFVIETAAGWLWESAPGPDPRTRRFIEGELHVWRSANAVVPQRVIAPAAAVPPIAAGASVPADTPATAAAGPVVMTQRGFPWLTVAILAALLLVFAAEIGIEENAAALKPTMTTLIAFGGLSHQLVLQEAEWYRLFASPFLHADLAHVTMNAFCLLIGGWTLERIIGHAWLAGVYAVGAICGSLASLAFNPSDLVSVGASGAIMGLFAAMMVVALRSPSGPEKKRLTRRAMYVLVPSLVPLTSAAAGMQVDYAAHFGGAIGGAVLMGAAAAAWRRTEDRPRFKAVAVLIAVGVLAGTAYAAARLQASYPVTVFRMALVPGSEMPPTDDARLAASVDLASRYPRDPRVRLLRARVHLNSSNFSRAERELRAGLAEEELSIAVFGTDLSDRQRSLLALVLAETYRPNEAADIARPVCERLKTGSLRRSLDTQNLCGH
jgi:rhomboid protease GluP